MRSAKPAKKRFRKKKPEADLKSERPPESGCHSPSELGVLPMPDATSSPLRIVLLDRKTLPDDIHFRAFSFAHELVQFDHTASDEVSDRIKHADIIITNKAPVRGPAIASARNLKLVAVAATGTDVIEVAACAQRGVTVSNFRNYAVNTVPEHTFALILALRRSLLAYRNSMRAGRWQEANQFCYFDFPINDLAGSTLGIIGDGALGRSVADLGRAFGMKVLFPTTRAPRGWVRSARHSRRSSRSATSSPCALS